MLERAQIRAELNISRKLLDQLWRAPTFDRAAVEAVNGHMRSLIERLNKLDPPKSDPRLYPKINRVDLVEKGQEL